MDNACGGRASRRAAPPRIENRRDPVHPTALRLPPDVVERAREIVKRSHAADVAPVFAHVEDVLLPALTAGLALLEGLYPEVY